MSERTRVSRPRALLRFVGIILAFGLTIAAVWMIALGHSQREVSLGVITGLWAALIGAMTFYSSRHSSQLATADGTGGSDVELRQDFAVELQREVSARRAYEQQLHEMVRREIETIQRVVGDQLGRLREDVATLRGDLVDQVGGKIRLERIETTRVIGSDIEALQNEVRQLAGNRGTEAQNKPATGAPRIFDAPATATRSFDNLAAAQAAPATEPRLAAPIDPVSNASERTPATVAPPQQILPAYQPYTPPTYAPAVTYSAGTAGQAIPQYSAPAVAREPIEPPPLAPAAPVVATPPAAQPTYELPMGERPIAEQSGNEPPATSSDGFEPRLPTFTPITPLPRLEMPPIGGLRADATNAGGNGVASNGVGAPSADFGASNGSDPFASLPRLSQFTDIDDPLPATPAAPSDWSPPAAASAWPPAAPTPNAYSAATNGSVPNGRRHGAAEDDQPPLAAPESTGGRRRRADGETNDVLARLLGDR